VIEGEVAGDLRRRGKRLGHEGVRCGRGSVGVEGGRGRPACNSGKELQSWI
jgi:hypothetical protein